MVRKTRPGAVRRPSRSRPQRLGSRRWQWIGSGGAHQRLPTRRRSSERERESRTRGRSATRAWPFPRRGGGHRRRLAKCVALQMDGWWRCRWMGAWRCRWMGGEPGALAAASVGAPNGTDRRRSASDRRGSGCAPALACERAAGFFPRRPLHAVGTQLRGCEGFSWYNVGPHVPGSYVPKSGNSIFLWNFHLLKNGSCVERCQNGAFWVHGHRFVHTPPAVAHIIVDLLSKKERRARRRRASSSSSSRRRGGSLGCQCCCPSLPVRRERRLSRPSRPPAKLTSIDAQSGGASSGGASYGGAHRK